MDRLISLQAAIDAANRTDYRGLLVEDVTKVTDEVVKELKKLPSAQPELPIKQKCTICPHCDNCDVNDDGTISQPEPQWIPCSERLPEEHEWMGTKRFGTTISDEVYVTFENPKGERFCKHLSFQNGKLSSFDQSTIDAFYKGSKPIAWMPLPEPWRGETDG